MYKVISQTQNLEQNSNSKSKYTIYLLNSVSFQKISRRQFLMKILLLIFHLVKMKKGYLLSILFAPNKEENCQPISNLMKKKIDCMSKQKNKATLVSINWKCAFRTDMQCLLVQSLPLPFQEKISSMILQ
jgi:hypothetical protein